MNDTAQRAVAVVGLGAILPDAPDVAHFWNNLRSGRYSISDVDANRWDPALYYDPDPHSPDKTYTKIGGWVREWAWKPFDWKLPIPPKVAGAMDDAQRWGINITHAVLQDYGYPQRPLDPDRTAVILGNAMAGEKHYLTVLRISFPEFARELEHAESFMQLPAEVRQRIIAQTRARMNHRIPEITEDCMPGELANILAGRIANVFNFHGPNFVCDAACASAMAAISAAVEGLTQHDFDAVVTGGIDRNMGASTYVKFCKIGALSATGSRPYAAGANGFVMGEGAALFLLRRLADAERDGDHVYAVLRGIGGSSDGKGKGITAPNPIGQKLAVRRGWENAGLSPATATYIEGHGTSTRVGDVVEVESMTEVFAGAGARPNSIALGSVKSNFGHLKGAAGAAGMLKAVLCLNDRVIPPSLHCEQPNPAIDFARTPFHVNGDLREWEKPECGVRRAGVSAFGFGGTNFHAVFEEHLPGRLNGGGRVHVVPATVTARSQAAGGTTVAAPAKVPPGGIAVLGADSAAGLESRLQAQRAEAEASRAMAGRVSPESDLRAAERIAIDFGDAADLQRKLDIALNACARNDAGFWKALAAQGIFRGSGAAGKIAFLFPGQGSQYVNMLAELRDREPVVRETFEQADRVMEPILGKPLTDYIFVADGDQRRLQLASQALMQTEITQPALIACDVALARLLREYGFVPDMVMGHSLGEYAALVQAGALSFAEALEAVAARGREMTRVSVDDVGKMAAVFAPLTDVQRLLARIDGYAVIANINSYRQCVIGGASAAIDQAMEQFRGAGIQVVPLPVSHAFHTRIVAPASEPLRQVLSRMQLRAPGIPTISNVSGGFYPQGVDAPEKMLDLLARQIASPVQFIKGLEALYDAGARVFVEVGPKKALKGLVDDVLGDRPDVVSLFSNHPKTGALTSFNQVLCGLYAAGHGASREDRLTQALRPAAEAGTTARSPSAAPAAGPVPGAGRRIVISGAALGLPGVPKLFDDENVARILHGQQCIDVIPYRYRQKMVSKHITRLVKPEQGDPQFVTIDSPKDVLKLAGRAGAFDVVGEFGVKKERAEAFDSTTAMAIAAGIDALRDAGIPLVLSYKTTTTGSRLPDCWRLPDALREDTGIIFASAFPGADSLAQQMAEHYDEVGHREQLAGLESLRSWFVHQGNGHAAGIDELDRRIAELSSLLRRHEFHFDRRFLFRVLSMGHSQFAEEIGARGPNTQINGACASTTQAVALAEDWIRQGRCRRVIVVSADNVTSDNLVDWMGAGFLATGAAATDEDVEDAATPFDRRRHGMIMGMGAAALVVEREDAVAERGLQPICEVLGTIAANSAFHGTRLDIEHIAGMLELLVSEVERRHGIGRESMAPRMLFMSHETYTPARGGSASAEIHALRRVFGEQADQIVITNTKGFTGHAMAAGIEDVVSVKALETGIVPPVPNFREVDPELGELNLSTGGTYPVDYALRLGAGFGSQIGLSLTQWIAPPDGRRRNPDQLGFAYRIADPAAWNGWLSRISGYPAAEIEVATRRLRVKDQGAPQQAAAAATTRPEPVRVAPVRPEPAATAPESVVAPPKPAPARSRPAAAAVTASVAADATAPAAASAAGGDGVEERVIRLVAAKTDYPPDMLGLDLDLEADLGVDTVKQAEIFAEVRQAYGIERDETLRMRDFPTLAHVVQFVRDRAPHRAAVTEPASRTEAGPAAAVAQREAVPAAGDGVEEAVIRLVAAKTDYPPDMLDLDLDLEADLGVDTVKQAEVFAAVRQTYGIERDETLQMRDFPTLAHVVQFVRDRAPALRQTAPTVAGVAELPAGEPAADPVVTTSTQPPSQPAPQAAPAAAASDSAIRQTVLDIVSGMTGYPADMLDMELDLEADLGIDTVKQAEIFAALRAAYGIPRDETLQLKDFPTLSHAVGFVRERMPRLSPKANEGKRDSLNAAPAPTAGDMAAANRIPRRTPVALWRPATEVCKATAVALGTGTRVLVMADAGGVGAALVECLRERGVEVLEPESGSDAATFERQIAGWLESGPVHGVYWLPALDPHARIDTMDTAAWSEATRTRVKLLYTAMRALYGQIDRAGTFLIAATRMGGRHGYDEAGALNPIGGAVSGFVKAYKRERPEALCKVVDFAASSPSQTAVIADRLLDETLRDPGVVEIGIRGEQRWAIGLDLVPSDGSPTGIELNAESVFLVTGAAGSIVSAIIGDLAAASGGGTFHLLDLAPEPGRDDPDVARFGSDRDGLKRDIFERLKAGGARATPAMVEKELARLERAQAALSAIESIERTGGTAVYHSVDLRDGPAVRSVVDRIRDRHGRLDVLIHAGGLEISRLLPDKPPEEFDRVFDVKCGGWQALLGAIGDLPLGAAVVFSSIAGRFGNGGQTDYSAANDLLCKSISSLRSSRPGTLGVAIDWTAWGGIGMATRGSIPTMMKAAGIDLLSPEAGIPTVRRELTRGPAVGEVVVGEGLGALTAEWDASGGLDTRAVDTRAFGPMIGRITGLGLHSGLTVETVLDPARQAFLFDHKIDGIPVLPGVMGLEGFAELSTLLLPGWSVLSIEDVRFMEPFKFYRGEPRTVRLAARFSPEGEQLLARCVLSGERRLAGKSEPVASTAFTATVRLGRSVPAEPASAAAELPPAPSGPELRAEQVYQVYFHGPAYRVLDGAWTGTPGTVVGRLADRLPPNHEPRELPTRIAPRLIELCFQTAGVFELGVDERFGLPSRVTRVEKLHEVDPADRPYYSIVRRHGDDFDADVVDRNGTVCLRLSGYHTTELPGAAGKLPIGPIKAAIGAY